MEFTTYKELKWNEAVTLLKKWREEGARKSEDVIEIWTFILKPYLKRIGGDKWNILEQVCVASFDCGRLDVTNECIKQLTFQFPRSLRVLRLEAMKEEMLENYSEASEIYNFILQRDNTNALIWKRKVALCKSQNKTAEAVKELLEYLRRFQADQEAWMELTDFYIQEQEYNKAAFCMEELILLAPYNHLYHQRYAEIRYSQGGPECMELAKAYFAMALLLNRNNMRALYGLLLSTVNVASGTKCTTAKKKECQKLIIWAQKKITQKYTKELPSLLNYVSDALNEITAGVNGV